MRRRCFIHLHDSVQPLLLPCASDRLSREPCGQTRCHPRYGFWHALILFYALCVFACSTLGCGSFLCRTRRKRCPLGVFAFSSSESGLELLELPIFIPRCRAPGNSLALGFLVTASASAPFLLALGFLVRAPPRPTWLLSSRTSLRTHKPWSVAQHARWCRDRSKVLVSGQSFPRHGLRNRSVLSLSALEVQMTQSSSLELGQCTRLLSPGLAFVCRVGESDA